MPLPAHIWDQPHEPEHEYSCNNSSLDCERGYDCYGCFYSCRVFHPLAGQRLTTTHTLDTQLGIQAQDEG